jgi:hypothetical protein
MTAAVDLDDVRTEALFASDVQRSQHPTVELVRATVSAIVDRIGGGPATRSARRSPLRNCP